MKKNLIIILLLLSFNSFSNIDQNKGLTELRAIKQEITERYKKELNIDFTNISENNPNEIRIFNETVYLKFLSKYVEGIKNVKIISSNSVNNFIIFADIPIEKSDFNNIYNIIARETNGKRLKLLQVPNVKNKNQLGEIIQEKSSERD